MKVLHVNTYSKGGAANAAMRLHCGLLSEEGVASKFLVKYPSGELPAESYVYSIPNSGRAQRIINKFSRIANEFKLSTEPVGYSFLTSRNPKLEMFTLPGASDNILTSPLYQEADIINLHLVSGFLDYNSFFARNIKPVVWTLHDMNAFLGGEHYAEKYTGIDAKGFPMPRQLTQQENEWEQKISDEKRKIFERIERLHVVTPSHWLSQESKNSELFNRFQHSVIPYGLPCETFKPRNKNFCREVLGLPTDKIILLFVADGLGSFRKGYEFLKRALCQITSNNVLLCAVGGSSALTFDKDRIVELGRINDERLMNIVYSAADAFLIPSLMDNLPNTVLESLACGVPVIGFPTGGISEMVNDGKNGYLSDTLSVDSLCLAITKFINKPFAFNTIEISNEAKEKYDLAVQARAYMKLYTEISK